jgi:hypothetical protein
VIIRSIDMTAPFFLKVNGGGTRPRNDGTKTYRFWPYLSSWMWLASMPRTAADIGEHGGEVALPLGEQACCLEHSKWAGVRTDSRQ